MIVDPDAVRILCFGDSGTHGSCLREPGVQGMPTQDPDYIRLHADRRWTGVLQRVLGTGYDVIEEGLNGRTTEVDEQGRPGLNGRSYFLPCLRSHQPLDVVVLMLGGNDLKPSFGRTPRVVAAALSRYVDDVALVTDRRGRVPLTLLVGHTVVDDTAPRYRDLVGETMDPDLPHRFQELSKATREVAQRRGVPYVDAARVAHPGGDGIHLSTDSHARLGELLADTILTELSSRPTV